MSEAVMWKYLKPKLEERATAVRISDRHIKGFPDLVIARANKQTGLVEMKYRPEGKGKIGLRPEQAIFAWKWQRTGYAGVVVRQWDGLWHFIQPKPGPAWLDIVQSKAWMSTVDSSYDENGCHVPGWVPLADWLLSNLFDRV